MIILIIILALIAFCILGVIAVGFLGFNFVKKTVGPMAGCVMNFDATRDAVMEYAKTHDGRLPNAATWQDDVKDLVKKRIKEYGDQVPFEMMKADGDWGCQTGEGKMTGMAINSDVAGKKLSEIKEPWNTILIFEIEAPKRNAAEKYAPRPDSTSPTMMGEPRGWIAIAMEGDVDMKGSSGRWRTNSRSTGEEKSNEEAP